MLLASEASHSQVLYKDNLFANTQKTTHTYIHKAEVPLKMDIYTPQPDTLKSKPVLLYIHGGGFAIGSRDHKSHLQFCKKFASKGYLAATMDYTLHRKGKSFGCDCPSDVKVETFLKTARDISRAVKYLLDNHKTLKIDTSRIVVAGSSAGAEAALHAVYWPKTRLDSTGIVLSSSFRYGGVISMAGAITELRWIDGSTATPTQLFHGTCDNLVPYATASHHYCDADSKGYLTLYGPAPILEKLRNLGKGYYCVSGCFGQHEWNALPLKDYTEAITDFLYHDVIRREKRQIHSIIRTGKEPCPDYNAFPYCEDLNND